MGVIACFFHTWVIGLFRYREWGVEEGEMMSAEGRSEGRRGRRKKKIVLVASERSVYPFQCLDSVRESRTIPLEMSPLCFISHSCLYPVILTPIFYSFISLLCENGHCEDYYCRGMGGGA